MLVKTRGHAVCVEVMWLFDTWCDFREVAWPCSDVTFGGVMWLRAGARIWGCWEQLCNFGAIYPGVAGFKSSQEASRNPVGDPREDPFFLWPPNSYRSLNQGFWRMGSTAWNWLSGRPWNSINIPRVSDAAFFLNVLEPSPWQEDSCPSRPSVADHGIVEDGVTACL